MYTYTMVLFVAMAVATTAEAPSGYSYNRPSGIGGYNVVIGSGFGSSEGAVVDEALLQQIQKVVLAEEQRVGAFGGGVIGPVYGVPSPVYGVPNYRVVGVIFGGIKQAIQVAEFNQISHQVGGGGYPRGPRTRYGSPY